MHERNRTPMSDHSRDQALMCACSLDCSPFLRAYVSVTLVSFF